MTASHLGSLRLRARLGHQEPPLRALLSNMGQQQSKAEKSVLYMRISVKPTQNFELIPAQKSESSSNT